MLDFTAIDFETANSFRGSPCSVGLVKVRDGHVVDQRKMLIKPPKDAAWFDRWNVAIHGITPEMVEREPTWARRLPEIIAFIDGDAIVAHNAAFDIGVLRYACAVDNIEWPDLDFLCSMVLSRRALSLPSYRLPFVVESLGASMGEHHDALADALGAAEIIRNLAARHSAPTLASLASNLGISIGHMSRGLHIGSVATSGTGSGDLVRADVARDADPDGYLFDRRVVFTGKLMSMTRQIAWDECSKLGAIAEENTTKRTNVLVVGDINPAMLRPGSEVTGKIRRAFELQDRGQKIEVMTEDDFLRCVSGQALLTTVEDISAPTIEDASIISAPQDSRLRSVPIEQRPPERTPLRERVLLPPKPLRRALTPTDQRCASPGCQAVAVYKTRSRPTWCREHIQEIYRRGELDLVESFTHPDDWLLTECRSCTVRCHYRFVYVLDKNDMQEPVCRACYWRAWAAEGRARGWSASTAVTYETASHQTEQSGFDYLGPLTAPAMLDDPHQVRCRRCTRITIGRLGDLRSGCSCTPKS